MDFGVATDDDGHERRFACMAGIGFDAKVVGAVTPRLKRYLRGLAFQLTAFKVFFGNRFPTLEIIHGDEVTRREVRHRRQRPLLRRGLQGVGPGLLTSGELETVLVERVSDLLRPDVFAGDHGQKAPQPLDGIFHLHGGPRQGPWRGGACAARR